MIVAAYYVAKSRQALFYPLDLDRVGYRVAEVLEFLIGSGGWNEKAFLVAVILLFRIATEVCAQRTQP